MEDFVPYLIAIKPVKEEFKNFITKILINRDEVSIGRSLDNIIVIADVTISRSHCIIKKPFEQWIIKDMSSGGILVNGNKIEKNTDHILYENDVIQLDVLGDYVYKFIMTCDDYTPPRVRRKVEATICIDNIKVKFEESQNFAIEHLEMKIQNSKQLHSNSLILKECLELNMAQRVEQLKDHFKEQIENLRGERDEVERQKLSLELECDKQLSDIKQEMDEKHAELMQQIQKLKDNELDSLRKNNALKEEMLAERHKFLSELSRESTSKQNLLEQLTSKIREQEEIRQREKLDFVEHLRSQVEYFKVTKDKELEELAQQNMLKERELGNMLQNVTDKLQNQMETEQNLQKKMEELQKKKEEEKLKFEELLQAKEKEMAAKLEAANKSADELKTAAEEELKQKDNANHGYPGERECVDNTLIELGTIMETELQCSICSELYIKCVTLNCSHTFCEFCINTWSAKRNECPMCRTVIKSKCRSLAMDSFIEKMIGTLKEDMITKRKAVLEDRQKVEAESSKRRNNCRTEASDDEVTEEEEDEDDSFSSSSLSSDTSSEFEYDPSNMIGVLFPSLLNNTVVPGLPGARYGGYGRCYKCKNIGHWAPGCPF